MRTIVDGARQREPRNSQNTRALSTRGDTSVPASARHSLAQRARVPTGVRQAGSALRQRHCRSDSTSPSPVARPTTARYFATIVSRLVNDFVGSSTMAIAYCIVNAVSTIRPNNELTHTFNNVKVIVYYENECNGG